MRRMNFISILLCVCQSLAINFLVLPVIDTSLTSMRDSQTTSSTLSMASVVPGKMLDVLMSGPLVEDVEPTGQPWSTEEARSSVVDSDFVASRGSAVENPTGKDARRREDPGLKEPRIDPNVDTVAVEPSVPLSEATSSPLPVDNLTTEGVRSLVNGVAKPSDKVSQKLDDKEEFTVESDVRAPGLLKVEDHHPRNRHLGIPEHSSPGSPLNPEDRETSSSMPVFRHTTAGQPGDVGDKGSSLPSTVEEQGKRIPKVVHAHEAKLQVGTKETLDVLPPTASGSEKADRHSPDGSGQQETVVEHGDIQANQFLRPPDGNSVTEEIGSGFQDETETERVGGEAATESSGGDNMPSFSEWTQKRLAEQEQKGGNVLTSSSSQGKTPQVPKMRQKNYASADCGAKIVGTNPEAQSSYAVLNGYDDEYMLNPCTAKIWLVIELCEPIQTQKIEVANFELFSSSPRQFVVYSSDRYPIRDWGIVGTFEAKEEKTVQSFPLEQKAFHKFIKIELTSHYGSEHYCPLSVVRLYGTSELEVLDTDDDNDNDGDGVHGQSGVHDEDGDSLQGDDTDAQPPNLFGSAKDAVMSIVKKAAEALSRDKNAPEAPYTDNETITNATASADSLEGLITLPTNGGNYTDMCMTPVQRLHEEVSTNTTINRIDLVTAVNESDVEEVLSCGYHPLEILLELPVVKEILNKCSLCRINADDSTDYCLADDGRCQFLQALIGMVRFTALCRLNRINQMGIKFGRDIQTVSGIVTRESVSMDGNKSQATKPTYLNATALPPSFETTLSISEALDDGTKTEVCDSVVTTTSSSSSSSSLVSLPEITPPLPDTTAMVTSAELAKEDIVDSSQSLQELIQPTKTLKPDDVIGGQDDGSDRDAAIAKPSDSSSFFVESSEVMDKIDATPKNSSSVDVKIDGSQAASSDLPAASGDSVAKLRDAGDISIGDTTVSSFVDLEPNGFVGEVTTSGSDEPSSVSVEHDDSTLVPSATQTVQTSTTTVIPSVSVVSSGGAGNKSSAGVPVGGVGGGGSGGGGNAQKESVFVRLSNRIKALELNMSLSSQYLEELSQRYRKQMEEMQRAFNKTIGALNETAKKAQEQDLKQQEMIGSLQAQIDNLNKTVNALQLERENLSMMILEPHVFVIFIELIIAACMYALLKRHSARYFRSLGMMATTTTALSLDGSLPLEDLKEDDNDRAVRRRNSFAGRPSTISKPQRRPSEEALNIAGSYADLMIVEPVIPIMVEPLPPQQNPLKGTEPKRRRHRHKKNVDHPPGVTGTISQQTNTLGGSCVQTVASSTANQSSHQHQHHPHRPPHQNRKGSAGSLFNAEPNRKCKRAPLTVLTQNFNGENRWQMADENVRTATTTTTTRSSSATGTGNVKKSMANGNRRQSCGLVVCNGVSMVCNERTRDRTTGSAGGDESPFSLRKFFQKWFWFGR